MHGKASTKMMSVWKLVRCRAILLLKVSSRVSMACPPLLNPPMLSTVTTTIVLLLAIDEAIDEEILFPSSSSL